MFDAYSYLFLNILISVDKNALKAILVKTLINSEKFENIHNSWLYNPIFKSELEILILESCNFTCSLSLYHSEIIQQTDQWKCPSNIHNTHLLSWHEMIHFDIISLCAFVLTYLHPYIRQSFTLPLIYYTFHCICTILYSLFFLKTFFFCFVMFCSVLNVCTCALYVILTVVSCNPPMQPH